MLLLCWATPVMAWDTPPTPLRYRNQNPLYLQTANVPAMPVRPLQNGSLETAITNSYSNIFEQFINAQYDFLIDFEQLRTDVDLAYGLGHGFTVEGTVPFYHTEGGFLDSFIQWYHNLLNLPNGGRQRVPNDGYGFRIRNPTTGVAQYAVNPVSLGIGDIAVRLRHQLLEQSRARPAMGWFAMVDLPTGKRSRGLGNHRLDYGFGLLLEKSSRRWHGFVNAGYFVSGGHADLETLLHRESMSFATGAAFRMTKPVSVHMQVHGGTAQFHDLGNIRGSDAPLDLIVGFSGDHKQLIGRHDVFWQIAFAEDLHANGPSVDFTAHAQFGVRWNRR